MNPFPTGRDIKRPFIVSDGGQGLGFLNFLLFDESCFLGADLGKQVFGGAFFLALGHELAFNGVLEQALFHGVGEALLNRLQLGLGFVVGIDIGLEFFNLGNNTVLLGKWRKRYNSIGYIRKNPILISYTTSVRSTLFLDQR